MNLGLHSQSHSNTNGLFNEELQIVGGWVDISTPQKDGAYHHPSLHLLGGRLPDGDWGDLFFTVRMLVSAKELSDPPLINASHLHTIKAAL